MANKVFGQDFADITSPTGTETVSVLQSGALKDVTLANLLSGVTFNAAAKATPVDADVIPISDSAASNGLKKVSWANVVNLVGLPAGYIYGLTLSNNVSDATNDIDISTGKCRDSTDAVNLVLASALTKRLDAAWAVGTNQGGLDTGAIANTTYHIWLIKRSDTGVVDALFSASASSPTMPANYDYKRRIGSIVRTGAAIKGFVQDGDEFTWKVPVQDVNAANPGTSAVTRTLTVPIGIRVKAKLSAGGYMVTNFSTDYTGAIFISDLSITDTAASNAAFTAYAFGADTGSAFIGGTLEVFTNTSGQVRSRLEHSVANTTLIINTLGWIDKRLP